MPDAQARKSPAASLTLGWQYLFPSGRLSFESGSQNLRRHHIDESSINKSIKSATLKAGIDKQVTSHILRHSFKKYIHVFLPSGQPMAVQI